MRMLAADFLLPPISDSANDHSVKDARELPEEGTRRRPASVERARPRQRRQTCNRNFKPSNFRSNQPHRTRHHGRRPLQTVYPSRILFASRLPHRALAGSRLFHLGPHGMQIVRSRNHRKQQHQSASQGHQTLQRTHPARRSQIRVPPPQPVSRQRHQHPHKIEQQFHLSFWFSVSSFRFSGNIRSQDAKQTRAASFSETSNSSQHDHGTGSV